jgi:hypothetical protein
VTIAGTEPCRTAGAAEACRPGCLRIPVPGDICGDVASLILWGTGSVLSVPDGGFDHSTDDCDPLDSRTRRIAPFDE